VLIRHGDGINFSEEPSYCDGSDPAIVSATICNIPGQTLNDAPFEIPWGSNVYVKIIATNVKGNSQESDLGYEAVLYRRPDMPINFSEDLSLRTISTIGLVWEEGVENGGAMVEDYIITVYITVDGTVNAPYIFKSAITTTNFLAISLTRGVLYTFSIQSRTIYGYSDSTAELPLLCAIPPDAPGTPTTAVEGGQVVIDWPSTNENGAEIINYKVYIQHSDGVNYSIESSECDGTQPEVLENRLCYLSLTTIIGEPWNLPQEGSIVAKVAATNQFGDSDLSSSGSGGIVKLVPLPPVDIVVDEDVTNDLVIRFTWGESPHDGGSPVIDYNVYYDEGRGDSVY
jgi:hypothetical protein